MKPFTPPAARLLALALAVMAVAGCPAPNAPETGEGDDIRPVKAAGGTNKASAKPTGASTKPTGSTAPGTGGASAGPSTGASTAATTSTAPSTGASTAATTSTAPSTAASTIATTSTAPSATASTVATTSTTPSTAVSTDPTASTSPGASTSPAASTSPGASASPAASVAPSTTPTTPVVTGSPNPVRENGGSVSLFAGSATGQGLQNGTGGDALFQLPSAVAADDDGNVYVADTGNNAIRKITPAGVVTLVAGGSQGTNEGAGATAQFNSPNGIAVDDAGVVYVADTNNNRVRKIAGGISSLLVGGGNGGQSLSAPYSVAVDRLGNLFIADTNNFRILKVPAGTSTAAVFAGSGSSGSADGTGAGAQFTVPASLATDFNGSVYVADIFSLRKITAAGVVTTPQITMADANEPPLVSQLRITTDRHGDGSVLYAADSEADRIYILRRQGDGNYEATHLAGSSTGYTEGAGATAKFNDPLQLFVTTGGTLFIPDYNNNVVRKAN